MAIERLYIVVREDLAPGPQAVQGMHALAVFATDHPSLFAAWRIGSDTLDFRAVPSEKDLDELRRGAAARGFKTSIFRERDLKDSLTAVAMEPAAYRLAARLPRALLPRPPPDASQKA